MNTAPTGRHRGSRGEVAVGALLAALTLIAVSNASPASAVDGVDLVTSLDLAEGLPVADGPVLVIPGVNNNGATDATNVVVDVALPAGASVADLPPMHDQPRRRRMLLRADFRRQRVRRRTLPHVRHARDLFDHVDGTRRPI